MIHKVKIPKYYVVHIDDQTGEVKIYSNSKHAKGRQLSIWKDSEGYLAVKMNNECVKIHAIVAEHFIGKRPDGFVVNHKDGNKLNNRPDNLEYCTISENIKHAIRYGLHVSCDVTRMPTYKDGRALDKKKYKHEWYMANKERIAKERKEYYQQNKDKIKARVKEWRLNKK